MESTAKSLSTGRPLSNVGIVDKTIKIRISRSATEDEVDDIIEEIIVETSLNESAPIIVHEDMIFLCVKPICPFCDMDFQYFAYLQQHLTSSSNRQSCLSS